MSFSSKKLVTFSIAAMVLFLFLLFLGVGGMDTICKKKMLIDFGKHFMMVLAGMSAFLDSIMSEKFLPYCCSR